ncbi:MAG: GTPase/DUF3482 domain-containing protein [Alphaproteobacteria bacterium]|nr:GTPase/DUF3482 domain-containing protein [Alphaproteobacteria bacterium]
MTAPVLKAAVVGHTNAGKTSLMRTLTRDVDFGIVSSRPATTRHVEASSLLIDGVPVIEFFDTPGLEDSSGLLAHLNTLSKTRGGDATDAVHAFLDGDPAGFNQEAKALGQVAQCDIALYVIDARERVLGKHRDELEILGSCARPILPVLNFVADPEARSDLWREQLARANMHAIVAFDTVVFDEAGERQLFEKMRSLMDRFAPSLDALIADAERRRDQLRHAAARIVAGLLIDTAAYSVTVAGQDQGSDSALEALRRIVRDGEQRCVDDLLELFRFRHDDYAASALPIANGRWGTDLFSPEALMEFGVTTGSSAATGALAGLAVDAMTGGLTLGAAAATGAVVGAIVGAVYDKGQAVLGAIRGHTELRVDDATVALLAVRQAALVNALLRRGHASERKIRSPEGDGATDPKLLAADLLEILQKARLHRAWSRFANPDGALAESGRIAAEERLATRLGINLGA